VSRARTLLVAANVDFLESVADWMAQHTQLEVVGVAHSGAEAVELLGRSAAEIVVMDVILPDTSGFEVASEIKSRPGAPLVVLLSFFESQALRLTAWAAGADGIVVKSEMTERLIPLVADLLSTQATQLRSMSQVKPGKRVSPGDA
jgi:DNA-binding NarL/FixJ family response regulator